MNVQELIDVLKTIPPFMQVCTWDAEEDDYIPVIGVIYEHGHTTVDLITANDQELDYLTTECED